ncbi:hypothetical protein NEF87_000067 [Candidatus Lokiarchaeum ossiferum]|uniref:Uncharacterized protein n=1 Tax=Candidatus Lokiarchaeum ossiferum TaxID=2951803 RepID=A0ABY6HLL6_9ARCH|nr:hypothetical protein NEF87_000067 [Candidatus Lokiarchaeum sp. B-35]
MQITDETAEFLLRHGKKMDKPVLLIYYAKKKG